MTARRPTTRRLFERLRDWRLGRAREAGVPAYVVFTDATLTAIAESEPVRRGGARRRSAGSVHASSTSTARTCSPSCAGADPQDLLEKPLCRKGIRHDRDNARKIVREIFDK